MYVININEHNLVVKQRVAKAKLEKSYTSVDVYLRVAWRRLHNSLMWWRMYFLWGVLITGGIAYLKIIEQLRKLNHRWYFCGWPGILLSVIQHNMHDGRCRVLGSNGSDTDTITFISWNLTIRRVGPFPRKGFARTRCASPTSSQHFQRFFYIKLSEGEYAYCRILNPIFEHMHVLRRCLSTESSPRLIKVLKFKQVQTSFRNP